MTESKKDRKSLSLYVHIPFCVKKCHYCDFLSMPATDAVQEKYVQALIREIETQAKHYQDYEVVTVFIGGGTPSLLTQEQTEMLVHALQKNFYIRPDAEVSIEVNPGTVTAQKMKSYVNIGINRLSIGMQSVDNGILKKLGRIHTYEEFLECYNLAWECGFKNVNVDIMSALPGQTLEGYRNGLKTVLSLPNPPTHISAYSLILEEGTPFFERYAKEAEPSDEYRLADEDTERRMYTETGEILEEWGYHRYEISNYALEGYECTHNKRYWTRDDYVGLGIGAASMVANRRWKNSSDLKAYLTSTGLVGREEDFILSKQEQMEEFMFLGLRMMQGICRKKFREVFGIDMDRIYGEEIETLKKQGLLQEKETISLTNKGIDVSNFVFGKFLKM